MCKEKKSSSPNLYTECKLDENGNPQKLSGTSVVMSMYHSTDLYNEAKKNGQDIKEVVIGTMNNEPLISTYELIDKTSPKK